jgi:hypothetical protein
MGTVSLPEHRYDLSLRRAFQAELERRLTLLPGVEHVALASSLPIRDTSSATRIFIEGQPPPLPGQEPQAHYSVVTSDYFSTLQIPLLEGRLFPDNLRHDSPRFVVINESMARQLWPGQNALGKRISTSAEGNASDEVIGVVRDVGFAAYAAGSDTRMQIYRPLVQDAWAYFTIVLRAPFPETLAGQLRQTVADLDADLPVAQLHTVRQAVDGFQHNFHMINRLLGSFALLGLGLCAIGLYGVIAGLVVQLVLGKGLRLAFYGALLGLLGSFILVQVLSSYVPGLPGQDWSTFAFNLTLLLAVTLLACWLPARRATRVDPLIALRAE